MEALYSLLDMTPARIAKNQQIAYRRWESWQRENAENAATIVITQNAIGSGTASGSTPDEVTTVEAMDIDDEQRHMFTSAAGPSSDNNTGSISSPSSSKASSRSILKTVVQILPSDEASEESPRKNHVTKVPGRVPLQVALAKDEQSIRQSPLFVSEGSTSDDSDVEDIARPQGLIQARHLTDAPNSPADSVLTDSSTLARWEHRKRPLDKYPASKSQQTNSSGGENDGRHRSPPGKMKPARDMHVASPPHAPTTQTRGSNVSGEVSAKRPRSPSATTDRDRAAKLRCERDSSIAGSSERSSLALQWGPSIIGDQSSKPQQPRCLPPWYADLNNAEIHQGGLWSNDEVDTSALLRALKDQIRDVASQSASKSKTLDDAMHDLREHLHEFMVCRRRRVTPRVLYFHRMLHLDGEGLLYLIDRNPTDTINWPFDVRADAEELYRRWCERQFDPDLFRGINLGKSNNPSHNHDHSTDKLDPEWGNRYPPKTGKSSDDFINGQWWPTQLAAMRDGAHSSLSWIDHNSDEGVVSCILQDGRDCDNVDYGDDVILTTSGIRNDRSHSFRTEAMLRQSRIGGSIRLLRSSGIGSKYAPPAGLRYDGLYDVIAVEARPPASDPEQHFRFRLKRVIGQNAIRWQAPHARPTKQELDAYAKSKRFARFCTTAVIAGKP